MKLLVTVSFILLLGLDHVVEGGLLHQPAPNWQGKAVVKGQTKGLKLADFRGQYLILFFYPVAFPNGCVEDLVAFNRLASEFKQRKTEIVACSEDSHPNFFHLAFANSLANQLRHINILSDPKREVAKAYGLTEGERAVFVIDDKGLVQYSLISSVPVNVDQVLQSLQLIQEQSKNGVVCGTRSLPQASPLTQSRTPDRRTDQIMAMNQGDKVEDDFFDNTIGLLRSAHSIYNMWMPVLTHPIWPFLFKEYSKYLGWTFDLVHELYLLYLT